MNIKDLLKEDSIILNVHSSNKEDVINILINKHFECQHITDKEKFKQAIMAREELSSTGVGHMIAIPHAQDETVKYPSLVAMVDKEGVDFDSLDKTPVKLIFMIAVPKESGTNHLEILAELSKILMNEKIINKLIN
ncbi:PTS sugar transporter subunit IIA [Coprobacillus cateniformis]|uniref:PTS sugar transporter subunit IIA n=1 Tax=Coprobacillus cateniformis TaxID=100884 RepID=UPI001EE875BE|nr:fructose PTS transporter subunit IIA [Coprobacillus cateniformis]